MEGDTRVGFIRLEGRRVARGGNSFSYEEGPEEDEEVDGEGEGEEEEEGREERKEKREDI